MIILSVNSETKEAKMTSLMRDTWVKIDGHGHGKLNAASVYGGPELTMKTINDHFGTDLQDYVLINISSLAEVIDTLGGIDIEITEAERKSINKGLFDLSSQSGMEKVESAGYVHLNGNQAVAYSRIRFIDSDYRRTERQRDVLTIMASKLKENTNPAALVSLITDLLPNVETNLSFTDLVSLAMTGLQLDLSGVEQFRVPVDGTFDSGTFDGVWCIKPDFEKNTRLLHDFVYGEK
jgi:LCP family protein required for cell wall assembly